MHTIQASARTAFRSKVTNVTKIAKNVLSMTITTPSDFRFNPGQWVDFIVPKDNELAIKQLDPNYQHDFSIKEFSVEMRDDPNHRDEVYNVTGFSMTSSPFVYNEIHLGIKLTDHPITNFIHSSVKEGDMLNVAGPDGVFVLPDLQTLLEKHKGHVVLIAAGIGITPILSMFKYLQHVNKNTETRINTTLLFSSKTVDDLYFKDEIVNLCTTTDMSAHLFTTKFASEESKLNSSAWLHGQRIDSEAVDKYVHEEALKHGIFMLCGPQSFVCGVEEILQQKQVAQDRIVYEKWW